MTPVEVCRGDRVKLMSRSWERAKKYVFVAQNTLLHSSSGDLLMNMSFMFPDGPPQFGADNG